jgi:hypothetical protein
MKKSLVPAVALAAVLAGCTTVQVSRMKVVPPREQDCELEFIKEDITEFMNSGKWELVGTVGLGEIGNVDPFSERYRAIVREKACGIGGEAVALMSSNASAAGPFSSGTGTGFAVLRRPRASEPPSKF